MATELGKAYVQIIPSAKGIAGNIRKELGGEMDAAGTDAGNVFGKRAALAAGAAIIAAGIGKAFAASLRAGGELEQSIGGVETLFKGSADKVKRYAQDAYKTAGVSANDYMENVTSFAASLLQSTAGDTEKAADIANMAMVDMSDNANKMGTSMQSIQDAYQGFSKQNYTMLDNLKLGYGGTKTEMERLLADAEKLTGVKYDIDNLSDVYEAIHAIQEEVGITGTTAEEASMTLQGSFSAMKAAFENTLGSIALGQKVEESLTGLAETVSTFFFGNFLPMVGTIIKSLPPAIGAFIRTATPLIAKEGGNLVRGLIDGIKNDLPRLAQEGLGMVTNIITGILEGLPGFITGAGAIIGELVGALAMSLPSLLSSGASMILAIIEGIILNLPAIIQAGIQTLSGWLDGIMQNLPEILWKGAEIIGNLIAGIITKLPELDRVLGQGIKDLLTMLIEKLPEFLVFGVKIIGSILSGVGAMAASLIKSVVDLIKDSLQKIKDKYEEFKQAGRELISRAANGIKEKANEMIDSARRTAQDTYNKVIGFAGSMASAGRELIARVAGGIRERASGVIDSARSAVQSAWNTVKGWAQSFHSAGANLVQMIANGIRSAIGAVTNAIGSVVSAIRSYLPFSPAKEGPLKDLHKLDFTIIADGIYNAKKSTVSAAADLVESIRSELNPATSLFEEFKGQSFESAMTSRLTQYSVSKSEKIAAKKTDDSLEMIFVLLSELLPAILDKETIDMGGVSTALFEDFKKRVDREQRIRSLALGGVNL